MKKKFLLFIFCICSSCNNEPLEKKYRYWSRNNDFESKQELVRNFNRTIEERLADSLNYPNFYFLKDQFKWVLNQNILINRNSNKAIILLMSIGLDNQQDTMGSVNVISAERLSDNWVINDKIDMTFYYFTHSYNEKLTFDKITELSTKRMINAGYMKSSKEFDHQFVDDNWNELFNKE